MENLPTSSYYDNQLSKARKKLGDQVLISVQLVLLSQAIGSVSSDNVSTFGVTGSKARQIYCYHWKRGKVARGNTLIQGQNFVTKAPSRSTDSTDNRTMSPFLF